ncbi:MAG: helix-hairpin-helix domain-containing protein [Proteocatella sp.]
MSSKFDIDSKKIKIVAIISAILVITMFIFDVFDHEKKYEIGNDEALYTTEDEEKTFEKEELNSETESDFETDELDSKNNNNIYADNEINKESIFVDIIGEVKSPSVVEVGKEERLQVAIEKAGGLTENAERISVNLAQKLVDGAQYIIPSKGGKLVINYSEDIKIEGDLSESSNPNAETESDKININTATKEELETLTGIGETLSQRIIEYREEHGSFSSVEEIKEVNGIGDKKFEDISKNIRIN